MEKTSQAQVEEAKEPQAPREVSLDDWLAEAVELFGKDGKRWRFRCPNCKHVQTIGDFVELNRLGISQVDPNQAYYSCIGRYDSRISTGELGGIGDTKQPCDYTMGGLFRFAKTKVIRDGEKPILVFEFAPLEEPPAEAEAEAEAVETGRA